MSTEQDCLTVSKMETVHVPSKYILRSECAHSVQMQRIFYKKMKTKIAVDLDTYSLYVGAWGRSG